MDDVKKTNDESGYDMRNQLVEQVSDLIKNCCDAMGSRQYSDWLINLEAFIPYIMAYAAEDVCSGLVKELDDLSSTWIEWMEKNKYRYQKGRWSGVPVGLHSSFYSFYIKLMKQAKECGLLPSTEKRGRGNRG